MKKKVRLAPKAALAALAVYLLILTFGQCSWLEPFIFLHAPWRSECHKLRPCFGQCMRGFSATEWKTQGELDVQENIQSYQERAERGDLAAQRSLGNYYADGLLGAYSDALAAKWWRRAAEQGDAESQFKLGLDLIQGGDQNKAEAIKWLRESAEQGNGESISRLADVFKNEPSEKYFWGYIGYCIRNTEAKAKSIVSGREVVKHCRHNMIEGHLTPEQKKDIEKRAEEWLTSHEKIEAPTPRSPITF